MLPMTGLYLGFKDPWNQTDAQLKQAQKFLISKKHVVRTIWSSETDTLAGIRLGRPLDRLRLAQRLGADEEEAKARPPGRLHACRRRSRLAWVGMLMLLKGAHPRPQARARVR